MQVQKTNCKTIKPPANRKYSFRRKTRPSIKNGGRETGTTATAFGLPGLHILNKSLKPISNFEIGMTWGQIDKQVFAMVDTEEKQLQAISDLFDIVNSQPRFKKLLFPKWSAQTSPVIVLQWLLRKLGPLAKGNSWTIDTYKEGKKTRYMFVVYGFFSRYYVKPREEHLPLDFLPALKKKDQALHDLIIDVVALVSRENKIPLWHEDGDFSATIESLKSKVTSSSTRRLQDTLKAYTKGIARIYLKNILERRKLVTPSLIHAAASRYNANSERKRYFLSWIRGGIRLAGTGLTINKFCYCPGYLDGKCLPADKLYKFIWSIHQNDLISRITVKNMDHLVNDEWLGPIQFSKTLPGKKVIPLEQIYSAKEIQFVKLLYNWLSWGIKLLCYRYETYFYKKSFTSINTPTQTLMEIFEEQELHTLPNECTIS